MRLTVCAAALTICAALFLGFAVPAYADIPTETGYTGYLFDPNGHPVTDPAVSFEVLLYLNPPFVGPGLDPNGLVYHEAHPTVTVGDGLFQLSIGAGTPISGSYDIDLLPQVPPTTALEIELVVNGEVLAPRQRALPTFFAQECRIADSVASGTIGFSQIIEDTVTGFHIANTDSIGASHLAANSVGTSELQVDAVDALRIAPDAVGTSEVEDNSLTSDDIQDNSISTLDILNDSITSADIQFNTVTTSDIQNSTITGIDIQDNSITSNDVQNLLASDLQSGAAFGATLSSLLTTSGPSEFTLGLGTNRLCAIAEHTCTPSGIALEQYCKVTRSGSVWTLRARGGPTTCTCRAVCF